MATLVAAYLIGWAAVSAYVCWLSAQNGRLAKRPDEIEAILGDAENHNRDRANAA